MVPQVVLRGFSGSPLAVVWYSYQVVHRRSSESPQVVLRRSSGDPQVVLWQSSSNHKAVLRCLSGVHHAVIKNILPILGHTTYSRNNMGQKCEGGNCGLWVLNGIILKIYTESLKKIMGAVWELPAK